MSKVYVVGGMTGEFEDRSEWDICAFSDIKDAALLCDRLNAWCKEHQCDWGNPKASSFYYENASGTCPPEDPQFHCAAPGVRFWIVTIPFKS